MAFLTAKQISKLGVAMLHKQLVLPGTVSRVGGDEFNGPNGATVTVRVPGGVVAKEQTVPGAAITSDLPSETAVDVTLRHFYHSSLLTDELMNMTIEDFGRQILAEQVYAVADAAEDVLADAMNGLTATEGGIDTSDEAFAAVMNARTQLSKSNVPNSDRFLAVSPDFAELLLTHPNLVQVQQSDSDSALRDAVVGKIRGFTVVESNSLTAGSAVAYHRSAFVFTNKIPANPRGAYQSAAASHQGLGLRHVMQYNANILSDQSVTSLFAGASVVSSARAYRMQLAAL